MTPKIYEYGRPLSATHHYCNRCHNLESHDTLAVHPDNTYPFLEIDVCSKCGFIRKVFGDINILVDKLLR